MAFGHLGANALDYEFCAYDRGKPRFRGPRVPLDGDYFVTLGGSETFGRFVETPFPALLGDMTGIPVANLGVMYAGSEMVSRHPDLLTVCQNAKAVIVQVPGLPNMTNRFYSVHPRRNDRVLRSSQLLRSMYPGVDFADIHFTGHLLLSLFTQCRGAFQAVLDGLRAEWISHVKSLIRQLPGPVILLWMADHAPGAPGCAKEVWRDPMFVDRQMLDEVGQSADHLAEVVALPEEIAAGFERMVFNPTEEPSAEQMLGPIVHQEAARQIYDILGGI